MLYLFDDRNGSTYGANVMIEQSNFYDSDRAFEIFTHIEDSIEFEACYFDDASINYYIGNEQFQNNYNVTVTRPTNQITMTDCVFVNYNNRRAFYVSNNIYGSDWFPNISLSNIVIEDSDNNKFNETSALFGIYGSNFKYG